MSPERIIALDPGDAKFMALMERFSERLDWMKGDADQRNRQLELQGATLTALEKGISKMEGTISAMRDELRSTAALSVRVFEAEKRITRMEDNSEAAKSTLDGLVEFKESVLNRLALIGVIAFLGGGSFGAVAIKLLGGQ